MQTVIKVFGGFVIRKFVVKPAADVAPRKSEHQKQSQRKAY